MSSRFFHTVYSIVYRRLQVLPLGATILLLECLDRPIVEHCRGHVYPWFPDWRQNKAFSTHSGQTSSRSMAACKRLYTVFSVTQCSKPISVSRVGLPHYARNYYSYEKVNSSSGQLGNTDVPSPLI